MRSTTTLVLLTTLVAASWAANSYTNKFDSIDVDRILSNDRILTQYIKCLLEEGSCTNEGRELKKTLPDALRTGCSKCTEKQKIATDKVIKHVRKHKSRDWERLVNKYDPKGEFRSKYESRLDNP
ncbi:ejaculatory bulb-specific protein 3-like [Macrosteles quadrilineatus]|uniref:ejaculatory bulb-specific protein 3-like n=1 Tax=Macrosteles quadrilineatus TaxID=74068 RepID=UPI0023E1DF2A|nr:ejaculatory bulb-specific protein 3-like [Macrosteles quadrilineatus]